MGFLNLCGDKGWGDGEFDQHCDPLGSPGTPLVGPVRGSMESNLTHHRLPGLNIGDGNTRLMHLVVNALLKDFY